ncbi:MAG TPA: hypothetical protein VI387_02180, partial [Candidatus Brocadiales bacterium]|nr:hypothetical protein [Candidatus Brocadiales bacterium]
IRCAILKAGQWSFDGRKNIPSIAAFRKYFFANIVQMLTAIEQYSEQIETNRQKALYWDDGSITKTFDLSATMIENNLHIRGNSPSLILTSPPYPGIHVLYHRWQVQGRRETPAPFWIANRYDGKAESYYTFGPRSSRTHDTYFGEMQKVFSALAAISTKKTYLVQMVAFSQPQEQLKRYLELIGNSGFEEINLSNYAIPRRVWRNVPNRKWHAAYANTGFASRELILVHRYKG